MHFIRTVPHLSRRHFLRGLGAALPLPFLEAMLPGSARAASALPNKGAPPVRLGLWLFPAGKVRKNWDLAYTGPLKDFSPILKPFAPLKDQMLVLSQLSNTGKKYDHKIFKNAHEKCSYQFLTCSGDWPDKGKNSARSFEQIAAAALEKQTYLSSLEIGPTKMGSVDGYTQWHTPDTYITPELDLRAAYERMFRGRTPAVPHWSSGKAVSPTTSPASRQQTLHSSVVDLVLEDAKSLRAKLGAVDAARLDQYLDAIHDFENRLAFAERESLIGTQPRAVGAGPEVVRLDVDAYQQKARTLAAHQLNVDLLGDLMLLAFQTDTTRVCTLNISQGLFSYPELCVGPDSAFHPLQHIAAASSPKQAEKLFAGAAEFKGKPVPEDINVVIENAITSCTNIATFYAEAASRMVQKAAALQEADGMLLDNCMILYTSYMATGGHELNDYPVCLFGKGGGTLKPGRHIQFNKDTPIAALYAELLRRMGTDPKELIEVDRKTSPACTYELSELT